MPVRRNGKIVLHGYDNRPGSIPQGTRKNHGSPINLDDVETLTKEESLALAYPWKYPTLEIIRIKEKQKEIAAEIKRRVLAAGRSEHETGEDDHSKGPWWSAIEAIDSEQETAREEE